MSTEHACAVLLHAALVQNVLLMNEISTGLDSATTYSVVELLRNTTHSLHLTTLVSLLQPSPEVYNLFDDVILLANGCVIPSLYVTYNQMMMLAAPEVHFCAILQNMVGA